MPYNALIIVFVVSFLVGCYTPGHEKDTSHDPVGKWQMHVNATKADKALGAEEMAGSTLLLIKSDATFTMTTAGLVKGTSSFELLGKWSVEKDSVVLRAFESRWEGGRRRENGKHKQTLVFMGAEKLVLVPEDGGLGKTWFERIGKR